MNGLKLATVATIGILALVVSGVLCAQMRVAEKQREVLQGLRAVAVMVQVVDPHHGAERAGLSKATLQTDVELRLRKNRIRVLTEREEVLSAPGLPVLWLTVNVSSLGEMSRALEGLHVVEISLSLKEDVVLARNPELQCWATTWHKHALGAVGTYKLASYPRDFVRDLVDTFCNDYLTANPNKQETRPE